jgi:hypothetical protein
MWGSIRDMNLTRPILKNQAAGTHIEPAGQLALAYSALERFATDITEKLDLDSMSDAVTDMLARLEHDRAQFRDIAARMKAAEAITRFKRIERMVDAALIYRQAWLDATGIMEGTPE